MSAPERHRAGDLGTVIAELMPDLPVVTAAVIPVRLEQAGYRIVRIADIAAALDQVREYGDARAHARGATERGRSSAAEAHGCEADRLFDLIAARLGVTPGDIA